MKYPHIVNLLDKWGINKSFFIPYGNYTGKIHSDYYSHIKENKNGKLLVVTAITPTPLGEGKTVSSISLALGFNRIGKRAFVNLRQPSAGPLFGIKGGAVGGGKAFVYPPEKINLNFTGDFHNITLAHNLISSLLENAYFRGKVDFTRGEIFWRRVIDLNDRFLRNIIIGLGGKLNGIPLQTGFDITPTSEIMAIIGLSESYSEIKEKINNILLGIDRNKNFIHFSEIGGTDAILSILSETFFPNIVQTSENTPAFIHTGPFANISYGNSSVIADKIALKISDYVITEAGFGSDIGLEKFFHIKARKSGLNPSAIVLVATIRGIKYQSGEVTIKDKKLPPALFKKNIELLLKGLPHLKHHIDNCKFFGKPVILLINKFESDNRDEIEIVKEFGYENGADLVGVSSGFYDGGKGTETICNEIDKFLEKRDNTPLKFAYDCSDAITEKVKKIATVFYNAKDVFFSKKALKKIELFEEKGLWNLPLCIAKTQSSISHIPSLKGVPSDYVFEISDIRVAAGAGYLIPLAGDIMTMPGLPSEPNALNFKFSNGKICF